MFHTIFPPVKTRALLLAACAIVAGHAGCRQSDAPVRENFSQSRDWEVKEYGQTIRIKAKLTPQPLKPDEPAMLEVRLSSPNSKELFTGVLKYRFAYRRGDLLPGWEDLAVTPKVVHEPGMPPIYDEWFRWAELIEPRSENGESVYSTPVMLSEGKAYVQFQIDFEPKKEPRSKPVELLDWFIYVDPIH